ncbi:MAG: homoserine O-succinyltransferase [Defluviitaleaceae bacterium]|nr:homoserine O-succinyltransferase [Defluviitaleaceae bacterium]
MPVNLPENLPAVKILEDENVFVMTEKRAKSQDIRPLKICILNLMPTKIETETQLLRLLSNSPLQINITLLQMESHVSKNTSKEHLSKFYFSFKNIKKEFFDGLIITGAPVETLDFEKVTYFKELCEIMEWSKSNVFNTLHICWGAMAGLYYHYNIEKHLLDKKLFGVFEHKVNIVSNELMRGFDHSFYAPHSRGTYVSHRDIEKVGLDILSFSNEAGVYIAATKNKRQVFITGHPEYDLLTLDYEYKRDIEKGLNTDLPMNYYKNNNPDNIPLMLWRSHAYLLFSNWLNYYVYQETFYDLSKLEYNLDKNF